jgi:hypothetical protein
MPHVLMPQEIPDLPERQRIVAIIIAAAILVLVLELVRRRSLREEYSVLWVVTAVLMLVLALNYRLLVWVAHLIGAVQPQSALFFGALVFVALISLQFSVRLSRLTQRTRTLTQRLALLEEELHRRQGGEETSGGSGAP